MDINMPEMDGFEASEKILHLKNSGVISWDLKIILISAFITASDRERAKQMGCHGCCNKPISFIDIFKVIVKVLNNICTYSQSNLN